VPVAFERLASFFKANPAFDCVLLASWGTGMGVDPNFYYYSGLDVDRATLIARNGETPVLIANKLNFEMALDDFPGESIEFEPGEYASTLAKYLAGCKRVAIPKSYITASFYEKILAAAPAASLVNATNEFLRQRTRKDEAEIEKIRRAAVLSRKAFELLDVKEGKTEREVQNEIYSLIHSCGGEPAFRATVAFGDNARYPHAHAGERKLKRGEIALIDWGAKLDYYNSDQTRCVFVGEPDAEQLKAYEKLQDVFKEVLPFLKPGTPTKEIVKEYERLLSDRGLEPPPHNLGHGIGVEIHEKPYFSESVDDVIVENCVVAIEPSTYCKSFGARFEDTVVVRKTASVI